MLYSDRKENSVCQFPMGYSKVTKFVCSLKTVTHKMPSVLLFLSLTFCGFFICFVFSTFTDHVSKGCGYTTSREANYIAFRKVIQGLLEEQLKNFLKSRKHHTCVTFVIQCTITVTINIRYNLYKYIIQINCEFTNIIMS